ncbi:hypothetical protein PSPO01_09303 [Paraphaeosphaeria sporulosa]
MGICAVWASSGSNVHAFAYSTVIPIPPQSLIAADTVLRRVSPAGRQRVPRRSPIAAPPAVRWMPAGPGQPCSLILRAEAIGHTGRRRRKVRLLESALHRWQATAANRWRTHIVGLRSEQGKTSRVLTRARAASSA